MQDRQNWKEFRIILRELGVRSVEIGVWRLEPGD